MRGIEQLFCTGCERKGEISMLHQLKCIGAVAVALLFLLVAGCTTETGTEVENPEGAPPGSSKTVTGKNTQTPDGTSAPELVVKVYFSNEDATQLLPEERKVKAGNQYEATIQELLAGPKQSNHVSVLPSSTKLRSVKVQGDVAYVDFTSGLVDHFNGGSGTEIMLVASIVNSLTEFPEIKKVQILVEGNPIDTISGHMDTSEPFKRMKNIP